MTINPYDYTKLYYRDCEGFFDEDGNRFYSADEVRVIISGTVRDANRGYDEDDINPNDYV